MMDTRTVMNTKCTRVRNGVIGNSDSDNDEYQMHHSEKWSNRRQRQTQGQMTVGQ